MTKSMVVERRQNGDRRAAAERREDDKPEKAERLTLDDPQIATKVAALLSPEAGRVTEDDLAWLDTKLVDYKSRGLFEPTRINPRCTIQRTWLSIHIESELLDWLIEKIFSKYGIEGEWCVNTYVIKAPVLWVNEFNRDLYKLLRRSCIATENRPELFRFLCGSLLFDGWGSMYEFFGIDPAQYRAASLLQRNIDALRVWLDRELFDGKLPTPEQIATMFHEAGQSPESVQDMWSLCEGEFVIFTRDPVRYHNRFGYVLIPSEVLEADPEFMIPYRPTVLAAY